MFYLCVLRFERKGLKAAIEAISCTNAHLLVIGQDKEQKNISNLTHQLKLMIEFILGVQRPYLYQMADGLLLPTLYDPFPNVVFRSNGMWFTSDH